MAPEGTILVTGTNGILGSNIVARIIGNRDTAERLHGLYTVRNVDAATHLKAALSKAPAGHAHDILTLDLAHLQAVRDTAVAINARVAAGTLPPIRALILNAGFQEWQTHTFTDDGFDMTFQSNYLSHWLLTVLLLGSLDKKQGRVVVVGSWSHDPTDKRNNMATFDFYPGGKYDNNLFPGTEALAKGTFSPSGDSAPPDAGVRRYGASKLCEVMMINELQTRLDKDPALSNISVLGVDPGGMMTGLTRRSDNWISWPIIRSMTAALSRAWNLVDSNSTLRPPSKSAQDVFRAAIESAPPLGDHPKRLYLNGDALHQMSEEARDPVKGAALWKDSVQLVHLNETDTALKAWD